MITVLVTGSAGFMGRHLCLALRRQGFCEVLEFDVQQPDADLPRLAAQAELVFHLAGVNRPQSDEDFETGNAGLTQTLCSSLLALGHKPVIVLSSSTQAELDNPYGRSKKAAEDAVLAYHEKTGAPVYIYRFPNVFGKWSLPNYNTVVATFCHNISRGLPVQVTNPAAPLRFVYIDDIVRTFLEIAARPAHDPATVRYEVQPVYAITLGELHDLLVSFRENRRRSLLPDLSSPLVKYLYSTYVSFYDTQDFAYPVELKSDDRGWLFELIKSPQAGQVFVSRTRPGITRGNHYHDTKVEKFCVIQGEGIIRFRSVLGKKQGAESKEQRAEVSGQKADLREQRTDQRRQGAEVGGPWSVVGSREQPAVMEYAVSDRDIRIVDIPPGYAHSIENTGSSDMITLFWASEIFDPKRPDTYPMAVK